MIAVFTVFLCTTDRAKSACSSGDVKQYGRRLEPSESKVAFEEVGYECLIISVLDWDVRRIEILGI